MVGVDEASPQVLFTKDFIHKQVFKVKKSNVLSRQNERNVNRKERACVKFNPDKTHRYQIIFYPGPDREGINWARIMTYQQDGGVFHEQSAPRNFFLRVQRQHHGNVK